MIKVLTPALLRLPLIRSLIRSIDAHDAQLAELRRQLSDCSAAMVKFETALTETVSMRVHSQMLEIERLSGLYDSLASRLAVLETSCGKPPAEARGKPTPKENA